MTDKEKAKAYDEVLNKLRHFITKGVDPLITRADVQDFFPELVESEDEKVEKAIFGMVYDSDNELWSSYGVSKSDVLAWLEKQGEQKQLYIRFGEIPTDEKSKIYRGEIEVGTENGVSVYPAFKTDEGDIVLGLSLPITKTTLYTQQHLIEYDNRPCYLVNGDYIGKDTDGQPLINNVSIIKKIDSYRVKEEKQDEQKNKINSYKITFEDVLALECSMKSAKITEGGDKLYEMLVPLYNKIHNAYLVEKQNEQKIEMKTAEESLGIDSDTYNKIVDECIFGEQKPTDTYCHCQETGKCFADGDCKANWSEEDDKVRTTIINEFEQCSEWCCANGLTKEDCIDWLKSIKGRVQPKQEWNEEDECYMTECINAIATKDSWSFEEKRKTKHWVKSLKQRIGG